MLVFHDDDPDGFGAAWALSKAPEAADAVFVPFHHGEDPAPAIAIVAPGEHVVLLDLCWDLPEMRHLLGKAAALTVIDHHPTGGEVVQVLDGEPGFTGVYSEEHAACVLAWLHYHPGQPVPKLLQYVDDRDRWAWKLEGSRAINLALRTYARELHVWDDLAADLDAQSPLAANLYHDGAAIERHVRAVVQNLLPYVGFTEIAGHRVPTICCTSYLSEMGEEMLRAYPDAPFAATFLIGQDGQLRFSLRSRGPGRGGVHVGELARVFGGGGHARAAGFRVDFIPPLTLAPDYEVPDHDES